MLRILLLHVSVKRRTLKRKPFGLGGAAQCTYGSSFGPRSGVVFDGIQAQTWPGNYVYVGSWGLLGTTGSSLGSNGASLASSTLLLLRYYYYNRKDNANNSKRNNSDSNNKSNSMDCSKNWALMGHCWALMGHYWALVGHYCAPMGHYYAFLHQ